MRHVDAVAPGWHPDPSGRWQVRWWDGSAWTDQVASGGRRGNDAVPGDEATSDLVNRVVAAALSFVDLAESIPDSVPYTTVIPALWREAGTRRDLLVLAHSHLAALEQQGSDHARARALAYITSALDNPPPLPR